MKSIGKSIVPILVATVWISLSEFFRNEILLKSIWIEHYRQLGLVFPSEPVNGAIWGLWSFLFSLSIFFISRKFSFFQTALLAWLTAFLMMWVVTGNLAVLPFRILFTAVPLSFIEALVATWIIKKLAPPQS